MAVGNSRLVFTIATALTGPLLAFVGEESFGFHISGGSSSGKTTALHVAASVGGLPVRTWRTTDNNAEAWALAANDGLLMLDELSQADAKAADMMAYMLGNSQGKGRMAKEGCSRKVATWRLVFLSTGEVGLGAKLNELGKSPKAGQAVRMIEIPADAGKGLKLFESLHDFKDGAEFAEHLKVKSGQNCGWAMDAFLSVVAADSEGMPEAVSAGLRKWMDANIPQGADSQVIRVGRRFALVAVAGELAAEMGVLPWEPGEAERAATICFKAWLSARGGIGAAEIEDGLTQVRGFIEQYGQSRFALIDGGFVEGDARAMSLAGYRRKDTDGNWEYLVSPSVWTKEVCKGLDGSAIARSGIARGLMVGSGNRTSHTVHIPGLGKVRFYHVKASILGCDLDA